MRWVEHVTRMGREEMDTECWWGNLREREHLGDPDVDGMIILRWIFRKWDVEVWTRPVMGKLFKEGAKGKEKNFRRANIIY